MLVHFDKTSFNLRVFVRILGTSIYIYFFLSSTQYSLNEYTRSVELGLISEK